MLYNVGRIILLLYAGLMLKLSIRRLGILPAGPKIFVSNHPSATDPFMIHIISPERLNVLITSKAFSVPVFGWFLRTIREIPVTLAQTVLPWRMPAEISGMASRLPSLSKGRSAHRMAAFCRRVPERRVWPC
jgi:1-acyl-sn-glycerol-3-phosphate acyltransferase